MSMRQLVSYDDIALYQEEKEQNSNGPQEGSSWPPPSKKHKRSGQQPKRARQHWDEPIISNGTMDCDEENDGDAPVVNAVMHGDELEEEGEESRVLTVEEVWDDSALIDAWNAATEEYEAYHGTGKKWKEECVNKSPLWCNVPPSSSERQHKAGKTQGNAKEIRQPLDHDTPLLDGSSVVPQPSILDDAASHSQEQPSGLIASQDEAFTQALGAMYWVGYWTAVYECRKREHLAAETEDKLNENEDYIEGDE